jgi:hypothetical protein
LRTKYAIGLTRRPFGARQDEFETHKLPLQSLCSSKNLKI